MTELTSEDIKRIRKTTGLSQQKFCLLLGIFSWVTVSRWERNINKPLPKMVAKLRRLALLIACIEKAIPKEKIYPFLMEHHKLLREYRPIDLLENDYSFEVLQEFVKSAKSGDMA